MRKELLDQPNHDLNVCRTDFFCYRNAADLDAVLAQDDFKTNTQNNNRIKISATLLNDETVCSYSTNFSYSALAGHFRIGFRIDQSCSG